MSSFSSYQIKKHLPSFKIATPPITHYLFFSVSSYSLCLTTLITPPLYKLRGGMLSLERDGYRGDGDRRGGNGTGLISLIGIGLFTEDHETFKIELNILCQKFWGCDLSRGNIFRRSEARGKQLVINKQTTLASHEKVSVTIASSYS